MAAPHQKIFLFGKARGSEEKYKQFLPERELIGCVIPQYVQVNPVALDIVPSQSA
jgi:hypothetical protein